MSAPATAIDPSTLRKVYAHVPSGLVTVAALDEGAPVGLLVATFTPVSLYPPLVAVNVAQTSTTFPALRRRSHWGLSVLGDHQRDVADRFRLPGEKRFAGTRWTATADGAVHVDGSLATLTTRPTEFVPAGDHVIVVLAVDDYDLADSPGAPLVFHHSRFHRLEKENP
ncbi:flavin reductase family protein [Gordonia iterans]